MFSFNKNALNKLKECKINIENSIRSVKIETYGVDQKQNNGLIILKQIGL